MRSRLNTGNITWVLYYDWIVQHSGSGLCLYRKLYGIFQFSGLKAHCECFLLENEM